MTPERNFYDTLKSKVFVYYAKEGDGQRGGQRTRTRKKSNAN